MIRWLFYFFGAGRFINTCCMKGGKINFVGNYIHNYPDEYESHNSYGGMYFNYCPEVFVICSETVVWRI